MSSLRTLDEVLFDQSIDSRALLFLCAFYEDERPLKNSVGLLDWRLRGVLSQFILQGWVTGTENEVTYIPVKYKNSLRHLLLVGLGKKSKEGKPLNLSGVLKQIKNLSFQNLALSESNFPKSSITELKHLNFNLEFII